MEGAISGFLFDEDDFVLIGEGGCATAALADALAVGATPIVLKTQESWLADSTNGPLPDAIFDLGAVPHNRAVLEVIQRNAPGSRIFLAGEIPSGTAFRPPAMTSFQLAANGEHPRRMERRALEIAMEAYGFVPSSLHSIHNADNLPPSMADEVGTRRLQYEWENMRKVLQTAMTEGLRPPFDIIRELTDTAVATYRKGSVVFTLSYLAGPFDTAYFDQRLADGYREDSADLVVLDGRILLLGGQSLIERCTGAGLNLLTVKTGG